MVFSLIRLHSVVQEWLQNVSIARLAFAISIDGNVGAFVGQFVEQQVARGIGFVNGRIAPSPIGMDHRHQPFVRSLDLIAARAFFNAK